MKRITRLLLLSFCLSAPLSFADWTLDPEGSFVGFASVKNDLIAENHSFTKVAGTVSAGGDAAITIDLASVETLIPIRNERMQKMLFDIASFPTAVVSARIDPGTFTALAAGESRISQLDIQVSMHGIDLDKTVQVKVTRSHESSFEVSSLGPILVHASQFGLADGVESLRKIAGLQSIDLMVPVTFDLRLVRSDDS